MNNLSSPHARTHTQVIAEAEAERAARHAAEVALARAQKDLRRAQNALSDALERQEGGGEETEAALAQAWEEVRAEKALRQQAEERLGEAIEFLRSQGVDIQRPDGGEVVTEEDL